MNNASHQTTSQYVSPTLQVIVVHGERPLAAGSEKFDGSNANTKSYRTGGNAANAAARGGGWTDDGE